MNYFEPHLTPDELRAISAIGLAHMGDAVYETLVRTWLCVHGKATGKELHRATIALVCAQKQAELAQRGASSATTACRHTASSGMLLLLHHGVEQLLRALLVSPQVQPAQPDWSV